jgi:glucose-1-phosphate thymidylyltransferase
MTKGIVLAGGKGTRLYPITTGISKQLIPVYDKPLIHYSIGTLMLSGIREILIITNPEYVDIMKKILGDGSQWGISLSFEVQREPRGIAEAFLIGEEFIGENNVALTLGDNIFYGTGLGLSLASLLNPIGATITATRVRNPSMYGVVVLDEFGKPVELVEKPEKSVSNLAVPGLYFYDNTVVEIARNIRPSDRNELEITAINQEYLNRDQLNVFQLPRGSFWIDAGSFESLSIASEFVKIVENQQNIKVSCLEEIAWRQKWISSEELILISEKFIQNEYGTYLQNLISKDR